MQAVGHRRPQSPPSQWRRPQCAPPENPCICGKTAKIANDCLGKNHGQPSMNVSWLQHQCSPCSLTQQTRCTEFGDTRISAGAQTMHQRGGKEQSCPQYDQGVWLPSQTLMMRQAAQAAPKPLSILVTVTPLAHEVSMPSKAESPAKEAP